MKNIISFKTVLMLVVMCSLIVPNVSFASHQKPTCILEVTTPVGTVELTKGDDVLVVRGQEITIAWESKNATKAYDGEGESIDLDGKATSTPLKSTSYDYKFTAGSSRVTCSFDVKVVTGDLSPVVVATGKTIPKFTGEVTGTSKVQLQIYKVGSAKPVYTSNRTSVKKRDWSVVVSKKLAAGNYVTVLRGDSKYELNTIATSTLTVGEAAASPSALVTTFVAQSVPLLAGGIVKGGSSVPVSYIQIINVGTKTGTVETISIKQNGSATTDVIVGFVVTDDQGMTPVTVGNAASPIVFKNGVATISFNASIGATQMRLYTVKAILRSNVSGNVGTQLKLDITSMSSSSAFPKTTFPIKGTTWTIGN